MINFFNFFLTVLSFSCFYNKELYISSGMPTDMVDTNEFLDLNSTQTMNVSGTERRIFGGKYVKTINQFPFMAYLYREQVTYIMNVDHSYRLTKMAACGSSILNKRFILTAAHCVRMCLCAETYDDTNCPNCTEYKPENFKVHVGNVVSGKAEIKIPIKKIYIHPKYKNNDVKYNCLYRFDIAIMELSEPLKFSKSIKSVKLPDKPARTRYLLKTMTTNYAKTNKKCTILGWGLTAKDDATKFLEERLKIAKIPLIDTETCSGYFYKVRRLDKHPDRKNMCPDTAICSKSPNDNTGICYGDSGGPIMCGGVQVGVSSWGIKNCVGPNKPQSFTRVDVNLRWIRRIAFKS